MLLTNMVPKCTTTFLTICISFLVKKMNSHPKITCNSLILQYFLVSVSNLAAKSEETSEEHAMMTSLF